MLITAPPPKHGLLANGRGCSADEADLPQKPPAGGHHLCTEADARGAAPAGPSVLKAGRPDQVADRDEGRSKPALDAPPTTVSTEDL